MSLSKDNCKEGAASALALNVVGDDHRLADSERLAKMLEACELGRQNGMAKPPAQLAEETSIP